MNQDQITGAIRQAFLTAAVGLLVKHGATAPHATQYAEGLLAVACYVWSWWEKREASTLAKADRINDKNSSKPVIP